METFEKKTPTEARNCRLSCSRGVVANRMQIVDFLAPYTRCVSLSHRALLASCTAEEAPQHTGAVHHHQSLYSVCAWTCRFAAKSPNRPHWLWEQQTNTAAATDPAQIPCCSQIYQEDCFLPSLLSGGAVYHNILQAHKYSEKKKKKGDYH